MDGTELTQVTETERAVIISSARSYHVSGDGLESSRGASTEPGVEASPVQSAAPVSSYKSPSLVIDLCDGGEEDEGSGADGKRSQLPAIRADSRAAHDWKRLSTSSAASGQERADSMGSRGRGPRVRAAAVEMSDDDVYYLLREEVGVAKVRFGRVGSRPPSWAQSYTSLCPISPPRQYIPFSYFLVLSSHARPIAHCVLQVWQLLMKVGWKSTHVRAVDACFYGTDQVYLSPGGWARYEVEGGKLDYSLMRKNVDFFICNDDVVKHLRETVLPKRDGEGNTTSG